MEIALSLVGTIAGAAAVIVAIIQLRRTPRLPRVSPGDQGPAAPGTARPPAVLAAPIGRLPEVRGRQELMHDFRQVLAQRDGRFLVVTGMGGVGKTTAALAFAEELLNAGRSVWWLSAVDALTLTDGFLELAVALGITRGEIEAARAGRTSPADLVWSCLESRSDWVLFVDNADDIDALTIGGAEARDGTGWLRPSSSGLIILTSRISDQEAWGRFGRVVKLGSLSADDGAQVLLDLAPDAGTRDEAVLLADTLGGLPLGLRQAGAFLASPFAQPSSFAEYRQALPVPFLQLMGTRVVATWKVSLDALAGRGIPQARPLLRVLACFAPSVDVPRDLLKLEVLTRLCDPGDPNAVRVGLDALLATGLVDSRDRGSVVVHPLVAYACRLDLAPEITRVAAVLLREAADGLRTDDPGSWPSWLGLLPHLRDLLAASAVPFDEEGLVALAKAADLAGAMLTRSGQNRESEVLVRAAFERTSLLSDNHPQRLALRYRIADVERVHGRHHAVQQALEELLADQVRLLGADAPAVLATRGNIAWALAAHGHLVEAEARYRALLEDHVRIFGPDHRETLTVRHNIAWTVAMRGRSADAERLLNDILAEQVRILGAEHPDTISTRHDATRAIAAQGRFEEAESRFRKIYEDRLRILGADHPDTISTRHELGRMMVERGDAAQAEALFKEVLRDRRRILGPDHPGTLAARYAIAWSMARRQLYGEAEAALRDVYADQDRILGKDHPRTLVTRHEIAFLLLKQGRFAEAEPLAAVTYADRLRILGPEHPDTRASERALQAIRSGSR
ncbi:FxSxx-COOH system tetratricopeptide repeat protein [Acrocarpospora macrocephala]|uniref:FxSxx-COOH system tetratricopeptide repeat protein n=1 Tax=Acrocarpospora macrocephala TaxID=150177 RepID=UPI0012D36D25|nr:FxSxx-COOH system tetratricopeptide repeat protein [Acrocarpospora macrocephala]